MFELAQRGKQIKLPGLPADHKNGRAVWRHGNRARIEERADRIARRILGRDRGEPHIAVAVHLDFLARGLAQSQLAETPNPFTRKTHRVDERDRRAAIRENPLQFALDVAVIDPGLAVYSGVDPELRGDDAPDPVGPRRSPRKICLKPQAVRAMVIGGVRLRADCFELKP